MSLDDLIQPTPSNTEEEYNKGRKLYQSLALLAYRLTYIAELMKQYSGVGRRISPSRRYFSIL